MARGFESKSVADQQEAAQALPRNRTLEETGAMHEIGALAKIQQQIMWNRLIAVVEEQAQSMIRTAFSTTVREAGDLSAGVFDLKGRMVAQAVTGTPGHVNSMADSVLQFLQAFPADQMAEGDVFITNDPWKGTGHLFDVVMVTPVFHPNIDPQKICIGDHWTAGQSVSQLVVRIAEIDAFSAGSIGLR